MPALAQAEQLRPYNEPIHNPLLEDPAAASSFMERLDLDPENHAFAWARGYDIELDANGNPDPQMPTLDEYRQNCLQRMHYLEQSRPGIIKNLNQRQGLYNYGRIPLGMLQRQVALPGQRFHRRIWIGMAMSDYNGSLMDTFDCLERAVDRLPGDTQVVIDEFYDSDQVAERLEQRAHEWKTGDTGPPTAQLVGFAAHGDPTRLLLFEHYGPRSGRCKLITRTEIAGDIGAALLGISSPDTTVLLDSCETGAGDENLARDVHEHTNLHVVAPTKQVAMLALRLRATTAERLEVTPSFYTIIPQGSKEIHRRSPARHYRPAARQLSLTA